jgi:hypothetical protein
MKGNVIQVGEAGQRVLTFEWVHGTCHFGQIARSCSHRSTVAELIDRRHQMVGQELATLKRASSRHFCQLRHQSNSATIPRKGLSISGLAFWQAQPDAIPTRVGYLKCPRPYLCHLTGHTNPTSQNIPKSTRPRVEALC